MGRPGAADPAGPARRPAAQDRHAARSSTPSSTSPTRAAPGGPCPTTSRRGRPSTTTSSLERRDGTWEQVLDTLRVRLRGRRPRDLAPRRLHRQPVGQDRRRRGRRSAPTAARRSGAASGISSWTPWACCWRWSSRRPTSTTPRPPSNSSPRCRGKDSTALEVVSGGQQVPQPRAVPLAAGPSPGVRGGGRQPAARGAAVRAAEESLGGGADLRLAGPYRRLSKDYEHTPSSSEAVVQIAAIHHYLRRLYPVAVPDSQRFRFEGHRPKQPLEAFGTDSDSPATDLGNDAPVLGPTGLRRNNPRRSPEPPRLRGERSTHQPRWWYATRYPRRPVPHPTSRSGATDGG